MDLHYLPCIRYLSLFFRYDQVWIEMYEHYQKGSYRNRCYIASAQGPQLLSVPLLKGKHQQLPVSAVRIAYHTPWHTQHWHAIQTAYGKSPFFIHYGEALRDILLQHHERLYDLNLQLLRWLLRNLHAPAQIHETNSYVASPDHVIDLRNTIRPGEIDRLPAYNQVFTDRTGFLSNLSALDLLMHLGPEGFQYLLVVNTV